MKVEEVLKQASNFVVEGIYLINDIKLKPFTGGKEGHFLTFVLQDKTGVLWAKMWDNAEALAQQLKDIEFVEIKGRTSLYNNKIQLVVDKIREAEKGSYNKADLIKMASKNQEDMWNEIVEIFETNLINKYSKDIWNFYQFNTEFLEKFKLWPGGKGVVHHAYQHGLLEHTLSVMKLVKSLKEQLTLPFNMDKILLGAFLHDIGKLDAYQYDLKTSMTNLGRLHEHAVLGYFKFRTNLISFCSTQYNVTKNEFDEYTEEIGHIILSHHGSREHGAIIVPMTIEARLVAFADDLDAQTNYRFQQVEHNADEFGWVFDNLNDQFYFKRPGVLQLKRRKMI